MSFRKMLFIPLLLLLQMLALPVIASDLLEVYAWARNSDLQYQAALSRYKAELMVRGISTAGLKPQLGYSYRWKRNEYESDAQVITFGEADFRSIGRCEDFTCLRNEIFGLQFKDTEAKYTSRESALTLTQSIYDSKHISARAKGKVTVTKASAEMLGAEKDLLVRVVETYLDVLRAVDDKLYALQQLESIEDQKKLAVKRFELGVGKETEVFDTQAAYDTQVTVYELAKVQHYISLQNLSNITGVEMSVVFPVSENMPVEVPSPIQADHWIKLAMQKNDAIKVAEAGEKMANLELREKNYNRMPVVNFAATYVETDLDGGQGFSPASKTKAYGVEILLPLYQGGAISASSKQAAYRLESAKQNRLSQRMQIRTGIINLLLMIKTDVKRYYLGRKGLESSARAYEATSNAYKNGASNLMDLFQAEKNYYQAKKDLSTSRYDYVLNVFKLHQLTGTLSLKELRDFNAWFQPHF